MAAHTIELGILCYPGAQTAAILGLTDLLEAANRAVSVDAAAGLPHLRISHWQVRDGVVQRVFESRPGADVPPDVVLVPPSMAAPLPLNEPVALRCWLRQRHEAGALLCSICAGAFVLAESGLLDGREITLPWHYADTFRARFPAVRFDTERRVIDTPALISASSAMAWTDLGLRLVARYLGTTVMLHMARLLLVEPPLQASPDALDWIPMLDHGDAAILKAQQWLHSAAGQSMTPTALADVAALAPRTLMRRFRRATGLTPGQYIQRLRVSRAQALLRSTPLPLAQIAWTVGYADASTLRRRFKQTIGMSPTSYRHRFAPSHTDQPD